MTSLSPKLRFLSLPGEGGQAPASRWSDLMLTTAFQDGAQAAIAEYAMRLRASNAVEATQNFYKLEGAREFLGVMLNLGEREDARKSAPLERLNQV